MPALLGQSTCGPWCTVIQKTSSRGMPWWTSGSDTKLSLLRAWVRSLVRELRRSHKPQGTAKKRKEKRSSTKNSQAERLSFWLPLLSSETGSTPLLWPGPPPQTNLYLDTAPFYQIMLQK